MVTALIAATHDDLVLGYYMAGTALVALVPLLCMRETAGHSLRAVPGDRPAEEVGVARGDS